MSAPFPQPVGLPVGPPLPPELVRELGALGSILGELGHDIEILGEKLCLNPAIAAGHMRELQAVDMTAQMLSAMAAVLGAGCMACAAEDIRLEALRERLCATMHHGCCHHGGIHVHDI